MLREFSAIQAELKEIKSEYLKLEMDQIAERDLSKLAENISRDNDQREKILLSILKSLQQLQDELNDLKLRMNEISIQLHKLHIIKSDIHVKINNALNNICDKAETGNLYGTIITDKENFVQRVKELSSKIDKITSSELHSSLTAILSDGTNINTSSNNSSKIMRESELEDLVTKLAYVETSIKRVGTELMSLELQSISKKEKKNFLKNQYSTISGLALNKAPSEVTKSTSRISAVLGSATTKKQNSNVTPTTRADIKVSTKANPNIEIKQQNITVSPTEKVVRKKLDIDSQPAREPNSTVSIDPAPTPTKVKRQRMNIDPPSGVSSNQNDNETPPNRFKP